MSGYCSTFAWFEHNTEWNLQCFSPREHPAVHPGLQAQAAGQISSLEFAFGHVCRPGDGWGSVGNSTSCHILGTRTGVAYQPHFSDDGVLANGPCSRSPVATCHPVCEDTKNGKTCSILIKAFFCSFGTGSHLLDTNTTQKSHSWIKRTTDENSWDNQWRTLCLPAGSILVCALSNQICTWEVHISAIWLKAEMSL